MSAPFIEKLSLVCKNNEPMSLFFSLKVKQEGVFVPLDLTNRTFFAQARKGKNINSDLICNIGVVPFGDPTLGKLHLSVDINEIKEIGSVKGYYDVLTRSGTGPINNLFVSRFIIQIGISDWS